MNFEKPSSFERRSVPETEREAAVRETKGELRRELAERYADLEYHNADHSEAVLSRASWFYADMAGREADQPLLEVAALAHDIVQDFEWKPNLTGAGYKRMRKKVENEEASAAHGIELLKKHGYAVTEEEARKITQAVLGTIPEFSSDFGTIVQPRVGPYSESLTWALAAADITTAGTDPNRFMEEGDAIFCEDHMFPAIDGISDTHAQKIYDEAIRWNESQADFARGQRDYWMRPGIPPAIMDKLAYFDDSIKLARNRVERRKALSAPSATIKEKLQALLDDMGFTRFGSPDDQKTAQ